MRDVILRELGRLGQRSIPRREAKATRTCAARSAPRSFRRRTDTFLGVSYRRKSRRRGKQKAIVAVSRTITEIAWHIIGDPGFRYIELGSDYHDKLDAGRKTRDRIRQLEQLNPGMTVTLTPRQPRAEEPAA